MRQKHSTPSRPFIKTVTSESLFVSGRATDSRVVAELERRNVICEGNLLPKVRIGTPDGLIEPREAAVRP